MPDCQACGAWHFGQHHTCPPAWDSWCESILDFPPVAESFDPQEATTVYAADAEDAALAAAGVEEEWYEPSDRDFWVRRHGTQDPLQKFVVTQDFEPSYCARKADD